MCLLRRQMWQFPTKHVPPRGWTDSCILAEFTRISFLNRTLSMQLFLWIGMGTIWSPHSLIFNPCIDSRDSFQYFFNIWNKIYLCSVIPVNQKTQFKNCVQESEIMRPEAESAQQRSGIVSAKILLFLQTLPVLIAEIKKTSWIHNITGTTQRSVL